MSMYDIGTSACRAGVFLQRSTANNEKNKQNYLLKLLSNQRRVRKPQFPASLFPHNRVMGHVFGHEVRISLYAWHIQTNALAVSMRYLDSQWQSIASREGLSGSCE